ncbi:hypothetical protein PENTCL1PPCAC_19791, partial [Pristionchus entomophagus]
FFLHPIYHIRPLFTQRMAYQQIGHFHWIRKKSRLISHILIRVELVARDFLKHPLKLKHEVTSDEENSITLDGAH